MIYIIKKADILNDINKIARARDYLLFNGTECPEIRSMRTGDEYWRALMPSNSILDGSLDKELYKAKVKKFFKKPVMRELYAAIAVAALNGTDSDYHDRNIFVILKNKAYVKLADGLKKSMLKTYGIDEENNDLVFLYSDVEGMKEFIENRKDKYPDAYEYMMDGIDAESTKAREKTIRYSHMAFVDPSKKTCKKLEKFLDSNRETLEKGLKET
jgi:hypothetical protein